MGKNTLLQTLDSASGSAPSEPDGHPPVLGLRSGSLAIDFLLFEFSLSATEQ
jgi:hypothetical protein